MPLLLRARDAEKATSKNWDRNLFPQSHIRGKKSSSRMWGINRNLTCLALPMQLPQNLTTYGPNKASTKRNRTNTSCKTYCTIRKDGLTILLWIKFVLSSHLYALSFKFSPSSLSCIHFYRAEAAR